MLNYANIVPSIPTNNVTKLYNVGFISIPNILVIDTKYLIIDTNVANSVTFVTNLWLSSSPVMEAKTRLAPLFCSQQIFCGYVFLEDIRLFKGIYTDCKLDCLRKVFKISRREPLN